MEKEEGRMQNEGRGMSEATGSPSGSAERSPGVANPAAQTRPGGSSSSIPRPSFIGVLRGIGIRVIRDPTARADMVTALTFVIFSIVADNFLTLEATTSYLTLAAESGIVALGVTMLMIGGEFDLSVGSVLGLTALLVPLLVLRGVPAIVAVPMGLGAGALIGAINGVLVTVTQAPSLIITLGALLFWRGVVFALTGGFPVAVDTKEPVYRIFSSS